MKRENKKWCGGQEEFGWEGRRDGAGEVEAGGNCRQSAKMCEWKIKKKYR